jgi:hypothetical protein
MVPDVTSARAGSARTANVLDHQGDEANRVTGGRSRTDARRWAEGEGEHHPSPCGQAWVSPGTCQERFASFGWPTATLDRTRPTSDAERRWLVLLPGAA